MIQEQRLVRLITLKLIPFLVLLYLVAYVDRSAVGFAKLHMGADIGLGDAAYGLGAGLFFIGYFLFEVPSNLLLDRFGARRWFARILLTWGAITIGMAFVTGPNGFYVMRFLLGAAEAGFFPGVLYYITQWYPVRHRGKILGLFILSQPLAMLVTGPLSGALLGLDGTYGLHGWQWLFICIGTPAVLLAWPTLRLLPDGLPVEHHPRRAVLVHEREKPEQRLAQLLAGSERGVRRGSHRGDELEALPMDARGEEFVLAAVVQIQHGFRDLGPGGDGVHRRAVKAVLGEHLDGGVEHLLLTDGARQPLGSACHASSPELSAVRPPDSTSPSAGRVRRSRGLPWP